MKRLFSLVTLLAATLLTSCSSTSQISLDYTPDPGRVRPGQPDFSTRPFSDRRGLEATDLGTVRTQIGTPLEHVQTRVPISQVITNAFGHGLQARGMLTSARSARYVVTGEVLDLYCQMLVRPYGYARLRVTVLDSASGQIIHSKVYSGERSSGMYVPGSGSPVPLLRDLVSSALQEAVDRALDDQEMRSRLGDRMPSDERMPRNNRIPLDPEEEMRPTITI